MLGAPVGWPLLQQLCCVCATCTRRMLLLHPSLPPAVGAGGRELGVVLQLLAACGKWVV